jgi:hypothetical protein
VRAYWLIAVAMASAGCDGLLQERPGDPGEESVLHTIPLPTCDPPKDAPDAGTCTGGGRPGDDCLMCHHQGAGATPYTFAGTLYDITGTTPVGGATIYIQDAQGNVATAISRPNGNFFTSDGFAMYPAKTFVSLCPSVLEMVSPVDETTGANCNTSGCHTSGFRVHLP